MCCLQQEVHSWHQNETQFLSYRDQYVWNQLQSWFYFLMYIYHLPLSHDSLGKDPFQCKQQ